MKFAFLGDSAAIRKSLAVAVAVMAPALAGSAQAGGVAFRFSDDTFGVSVAGDMSADSSAQFDWLHHEDDADMIGLGVFANGQRGSLTGRVGVKAVGVKDNESNFDGGAVAFGGDLGLPFNDLIRARAGFYYAPESTTFSDVTGYREWTVSAEFTLFQNSAIQIGVMDIEFDSDGPGEIDFDDGVFLRLQLRL